MLSDRLERADRVGPYGKSLLYLVSRALETRHGQSILGMNRFHQRIANDPNFLSPELLAWRKGGWAREATGHLIVSDAWHVNTAAEHQTTQTHGSFDNQVELFDRMLSRVLDTPVAGAFVDLRTEQ